MQRRHAIVIGIVALAAPLIAFLAGREEPVNEDEEPPGTQIVLQWLDSGPADSSTRVEPMLDLLDGLSDDLYVVDSFDLGGGTTNVFLYSTDPDTAVARVIQIFADGLLPQGIRIGVANSEGGDPSSRTYRPVYPAGLDDFQLIYPSENALKNRENATP